MAVKYIEAADGEAIRWTPPVKVNQVVQVRKRKYLVTNVAPPVYQKDDTLVELVCLDDDATGETLEVLWEKEVEARVEQLEQRTLIGFDEPSVFAAYYHVLLWNRVTATDPKLFQAPYRAGIQVTNYQLEPLRKALSLPRVNLFIADDVGLGKTIEAGLILREMALRHRVKRVVVAAPPSVVQQWSEELKNRFGFNFVIFDRKYMRTCRQKQGYGINPWTTHHNFIISHALLRDEAYAGPLREWLRQAREGSLLILDEAHHAAPASGLKYAVDSKFTRSMHDLVPYFEHRLFLSATPHNGHSNSFSALLEMLDPQRFCRGVPVNPSNQNEVMVRRLKSDLRRIQGAAFPVRNVVRLDINHLPEDTPELVLSQILERYREAREARYKSATKAQKASGMLVINVLQKRLLSSIYAFAYTLQTHQRTLDKETRRLTSKTLANNLLNGTHADDEDAERSEEELARDEQIQLAKISARQVGIPPVTSEEKELVSEMYRIASQERDLDDHKVKVLLQWIKKHMCPDLDSDPNAYWTQTRIVIFTEYADTKNYLQKRLQAHLLNTHQGTQRIKTFHGGIGEEQRELIKAAFNSDPQDEPLRILIATDAAREGVNLQNHCAHLFHFDNPWNPTRMEQRNGRIDRKLQRAKEVFCHYFVYQQRVEDRVIDTLIRKTETIMNELGSMSPVLEYNMGRILEKGIEHKREKNICDAIEKDDETTTKYSQTIIKELDNSRVRDEELNDQINVLRDLLGNAQQWLQLSPQSLQKTVDTALKMLGSDGLIPDAKYANAWHIPDLSTTLGRSWTQILDSLRPPREKDEDFFKWRNTNEPRPVVFKATETMDTHLVHLHLEHVLIQRLFAYFTSQGFTKHKLHKVCIVKNSDPRPMVMLLGRLSVYGPAASRLHDEIFSVSARWQGGFNQETNHLDLFDDAENEKLQHQLLDTLKYGEQKSVNSQAQDLIRHHCSNDETELKPHLEKMAEQLRKERTKELQRRGKAEAAAMRKILRAQKTLIEKTQKKLEEELQTSFEFMESPEQKRREADFQAKRLISIDREIEEEPKIIEANYQVTCHRFEIVGQVYLWPESQ